MAACVASISCAAVDLGPFGCVLHTVGDLTTTYDAPGVTQFVLNRQCPPTTPQLTTKPSAVAATNQQTSLTGNCFDLSLDALKIQINMMKTCVR